MDFKKHFEISWKLTLEFIVPLVIMTLVMVAASSLSLGILAPVTMAGYMHSILLMVRDGREPKVQDIFSQMKLFFPLLGFGIVVLVAALIGFMLLLLPGIVICVGVSYFCLFMIPLMTDKNMGVVEAVKASFAMTTVKDKILEHVIVLLIFTGITSVGASVFIGWLFTQPLATIFLISVYQERIGGLEID